MAPPLVSHFGTVIDETVQYLKDEDGSVEYEKSYLGGGAYYGAIGSRIWLSPDAIKVMVDSDEIPPATFAKLSDVDASMWVYRKGPERRAVRSLIQYRWDKRTFKYISPPASIYPNDVYDTLLYGAKCLHLVITPQSMSEFVKQLDNASPPWSPVLVYEPIPFACTSENLHPLMEVIKHVDVFSPNHKEAKAFLASEPLSLEWDFKGNVEQMTKYFLDAGVGKNGEGSVVIRCGKLGCCVAKRGAPLCWVPPYWSSREENAQVIGTEGAGNSFLGGLTAAIALGESDIIQAAAYGTVSASFVVEQFGGPSQHVDENGQERWNGDLPKERLDELVSRISYPPTPTGP